MKKLLVVTYYWPPAGGVAVQRTTKFCKYLNEFGWEPIILTVADGNFEYNDASLDAELSHIEHIVRTRSMEPHAIYEALTGKGAGKSKAANPIPTPTKAAPQKPSRLHQWANWLRLNLFIPDSRIGWIPFAVRGGKQAIERFKPDAIYSSAPPFSVHLVARRLARWSGLPWLADFRDPWVENTLYNTASRNPLSAALNRRMERQCLRDADKIVTVGPHMKQLLDAKLLPGSNKVEVIYNGADFWPTSAPEQPAQFHLSYYGHLYDHRFPNTLFEAIAELINEHSDFARDARCRLFGNQTPGVISRLQALFDDTHLSIAPAMPHQAFRQSVAEPQVLLLSIDRIKLNKLIVLGKTFDYLPTGNPIIGVGPQDGDAAGVLEQTGAGKMFDYDDKAALKTELLSRHEDWQQGQLNRGPNTFLDFDRRKQTGELALLLTQLMSESQVKTSSAESRGRRFD